MNSKNKAAIFLIVVAVLLMVGIVVMNVSISDIKPVSKIFYKPSEGKLSGDVEVTVEKNPIGGITP